MMALAQDWRDLGITSETTVCLSVLAAYLKSPNPTYATDGLKGDPGDDGPIRALIVSLLCDDGVPEFGGEPGGCRLIERADLRAVELIGSLNNVISLREAKLSEASFVGVRVPDGMHFEWAQLHAASMNGVNLRRAQFQSAWLYKAVLWRTDLRGADFTNANPDPDWLDNAIYDDQTIWPKDFVPPESARKV
jgi:hypothetical protein